MIRSFQDGDHISIAQIFSRAVHEIASEVYTTEQCLAWSEITPNYEHWKARCLRKQPLVFVTDSQISGFLELDPDGHIDCAYINPDFKRRGIMTQLVQHAVTQCISLNVEKVYVEASLCAQPLFTKLGFRIVREKLVNIGNQQLKNFDMELPIGLAAEFTLPASDAMRGDETEFQKPGAFPKRFA